MDKTLQVTICEQADTWMQKRCMWYSSVGSTKEKGHENPHKQPTLHKKNASVSV